MVKIRSSHFSLVNAVKKVFVKGIMFQVSFCDSLEDTNFSPGGKPTESVVSIDCYAAHY